MQRVVYQGGHDLLPRMVGRAALFQAYTSVFGAGGLALGFLHAPPGLHFLSGKLGPLMVAAFGIGSYMMVKNINSRVVSRITLNEQDSTVKIETISTVGRVDPSFSVPLKSIAASPFAPASTQMLRANGKTLMVNHGGGKHTDMLFFSSLTSGR